MKIIAYEYINNKNEVIYWKIMIFNLLLYKMRTDKYGWASIQYTNKKQAILYTQNRELEWDVVNPLNSIVLFGYQ